MRASTPQTVSVGKATKPPPLRVSAALARASWYTLSMPVYQYKARDRQGRLVEATIEAEDLRTAARLLRDRGLFVAEIKEPGKGLQAEVRIPALERGPGLKDLAIFSRQLATMLGAGLTLLQALAILERQTENRKFREILKQVRTDVEGGWPSPRPSPSTRSSPAST